MELQMVNLAEGSLSNTPDLRVAQFVALPTGVSFWLENSRYLKVSALEEDKWPHMYKKQRQTIYKLTILLLRIYSLTFSGNMPFQKKRPCKGHFDKTLLYVSIEATWKLVTLMVLGSLSGSLNTNAMVVQLVWCLEKSMLSTDFTCKFNVIKYCETMAWSKV